MIEYFVKNKNIYKSRWVPKKKLCQVWFSLTFSMQSCYTFWLVIHQIMWTHSVFYISNCDCTRKQPRRMWRFPSWVILTHIIDLEYYSITQLLQYILQIQWSHSCLIVMAGILHTHKSQYILYHVYNLWIFWYIVYWSSPKN